MYLCVRVCVWGRRSWEKWKEREKKEKIKEEKIKQKLIHTDKHTDKQTDGQTDANHSLKWDTILNNIVYQIQSNQIESNWIEWNGDQISRRDKIKEHEIWYHLIL